MANAFRFTLLAACVLSGCQLLDGTSEAPIALTTHGQSYRPNSSVTATLANNGSPVFEAGICASLEMRSGDKWLPQSRGESICPAVLLRLKPGKDAEVFAYIGQDQEPGEYRLTTVVEVGRDEMLVTSNVFAVLP